VALATSLWLTGCGGGSSSVTTVTGTGAPVALVSATTPTGSNTTEVLVDAGPASFSVGAVNVPYVTVTVCAPSSTRCVTIDHVFLDTGSYGLRLLKSTVQSLNLPAIVLNADAQRNTAAGNLVECYPFVLGGVWGPLASADLHIAGETATGLPIQVIDDTGSGELLAPDDCKTAAHGALYNSVSGLQAKGIMGIGMVGLDCGIACTQGNYAGFHIQYYVCPGTQSAQCAPAAVPAALQVQNPVVHLTPDDGNLQPDNNGTILVMPAVPTLGATVAKGRLVFGIGSRSNNQISPAARTVAVETNPAASSYLYFTTSLGTARFSDSYIDSGSNAYFYNDNGIAGGCQGTAPSATSGWYCPSAPNSVQRSAVLSDILGANVPVDFNLTNADVLFQTGSAALGNLGASIPQAPQTFVWGFPFFYGRSVYTSIWGQTLATRGPWNAF
jgi:hypothetical protein